MDPTATLETVRQWSVEDRLGLVFGLWDQLVEDGLSLAPTDELSAEIDRRMAAHEANPGNVRSWDEVQERVRVRNKLR